MQTPSSFSCLVVVFELNGLQKIEKDSGANECQRAYTCGNLGTSFMDMPAKVRFLENAIANQQNTLRLQTALAAILFIGGLTVVVLSLVSPGLILAASLKSLQTLGGTLIAVSG